MNITKRVFTTTMFLALPLSAATFTLCSGDPGETNNYISRPNLAVGFSPFGCGVTEARRKVVSE